MIITNNFVKCMIYYDGINNARIRIVGRYLKKCNISILVNDEKHIPIDNIILNRRYVINRIFGKKDNLFDYYLELPKGNSVLKLLINDDVIYEKRISKAFLIKEKINIYIKKISLVLKRVPGIIFKTIKLMWHRHHFLIPLRMIKQYIFSFYNNINRKNVDELYYNPLIERDYLKWVNEQIKVDDYEEFDYNPLISIIIPVYNVSRELLSECLDSILEQSYKNFEICIADDCSDVEETIQTLKEYEGKYPNIKIVYRDKNGHISEASNSALSIAEGDFIGLVDNDDVLDKDALYEVVKKLNEDNSLDLIYTDEDKLNFSGNRCYPHFKPDFSIDTFLSSNYFCHFTVIRKKIVDKLKGFRSEYNGAQDYDLFLRVIDNTKKIGHVSKVLYHWRMTENSTSSNSDHKNYAYDAGKRAIEDYLKRNKIKAKVYLMGEPQMYKIKYLYDKEPMISIIIPTKDKASVLDDCLSSIFNNTNYTNYEVIVIDNNSVEEKTFDLLKTYKDRYDNFVYYRYDCEFNYSFLNNEGVKKSNGEYVVLLNNDTKIISNDWLKDMVGYAMQKHIGCVGAKLLYCNKTVQHSGVALGVGGIAMHAFCGTNDKDYGYFGRLSAVYDWSCVTAACLMIKKSKYLEVDGLDEKLKVAYNDVDFNLKILDKGYNNVVIPYIKLFHFESSSRGNDLSDSQIERFKNETDYMCDKWKDKLIRDGFYNDNFSYDYAFRLDKRKMVDNDLN